MAHDYKMITWTPFKKRYDTYLLLGILFYLLSFTFMSYLSQPEGEAFSEIQVLMRATGSLSFIMLTIILCIGPMARLTKRAIPFLYNRRHFGVLTFFVALIHAGLVLLWYHGFGEINPILSLFVSNPNYTAIQSFPFEVLGVIAFFILFLMAATSHDFWNANLGPGLWKAIHMSVYFAYILLLGHILLGVIQFEKSTLYTASLAVSAFVVCGLHFAAARKSSFHAQEGADWLQVAPLKEFENNRAKIVTPPEGERIAVFFYDGKLSAVSNVCRHQGGPLGEGKIVDGCITCPWHGFQYKPDDGQSPAPFTEKIATYNLKLEGDVVFVNKTPNPPGTKVDPIRVASGEGE